MHLTIVTLTLYFYSMIDLFDFPDENGILSIADTVLAFLATLQCGNGAPQDHSPGVDNGNTGDSYFIVEHNIAADTPTDIRKKRAFAPFSPFVKAWRTLIKTTFAIQRTIYDNKQEVTFLKRGTLDNAIDDFYSLGPTSIHSSDFGLEGFVNNQVHVILKQPTGKNYPPALGIMDTKTVMTDYPIDRNVNINVLRMILYFESKSKAKAILRDWDTYRLRQ